MAQLEGSIALRGGGWGGGGDVSAKSKRDVLFFQFLKNFKNSKGDLLGSSKDGLGAIPLDVYS